MEAKTAPRLPERAAAARKAEPVKASVRRGSGVRLTFIASTIPLPASGYGEEGARSSSAAAPVNNSPVEGKCGASRDARGTEPLVGHDEGRYGGGVRHRENNGRALSSSPRLQTLSLPRQEV